MVGGEGGMAKDMGGDDRRPSWDAEEGWEAVVMVKRADMEEWAGGRGVEVTDGGEGAVYAVNVGVDAVGIWEGEVGV